MAFTELGWLTVKKLTQAPRGLVVLLTTSLVVQQLMFLAVLNFNSLVMNQTAIIVENHKSLMEDLTSTQEEIASGITKLDGNVMEFQLEYTNHWPKLDPDEKDKEYVSREDFDEFKKNYAKRWLAEPEGEYVTSIKFVEKLDEVIALLKVPLVEKLNAVVETMEFPACQTVSWDGVLCENDPFGIGPINCDEVVYEGTTCEKPVFIGI
ncbi:hypothetical protein [Beihai mantis shrimp virus 1]|uniref:hypothetical protein n=1 Tax=Beihai mantis shrimp virus 1 TaxID=1922428 RepID=UPI000909CCF7|nr:hypothetical protein [Beihai mantis shrimp virus 1]APG77574.1 hypothetical protein [Beihai mantis shrimp virus 1]